MSPVIARLSGWYQDWNRAKYLSRFECWLNRSLWALLAIALVYVILQHVILADVPEIVYGASRLGELCYDLAIAYAGAFIFYLLVVRVPLRRDRANVYRHVGPLIGLIVAHADGLMTSLNKAAKIDPPDRENTWANIQELCGKIGPSTQAEGLFVSTSGIAQNTVFSVIVDRMNRTRAGIQQILAFSSFLATDLIDLLLAVEEHSHFRSFSEQVMIIQNTGIPIENKDLSLWAHQIFNYATLIHELDDYAQTFGLTTTYEPRPGLIAGTEREPESG